MYFLSFQKVENSQERHDRIIRWYENMHSESLCALSRLGRISEFTSRRLKRQLQQILTKKLQNFIYVFFRVLLSSTHQSHTKGPLLFSPRNPSVPHRKSLSSTHPSVPHQKSLSSTPKTPRFNTKKPSVQHTPKFTPKTSQYHTPLSSTP